MGLIFSYWWILLPAIVFGFIAQSMVKSTYKSQQRIKTQKNITGSRMAAWILKQNGLDDVKIREIRGKLSDHYDPRAKELRLSSPVYNGTDVAALGIAAHEAGHAIQHGRSYAPIAIRNTVYPVATFGSNLGPILVIGGLFLGSVPFLINLGIILFAFAVAFTVLTLPIEFNASGRAVRILRKSGAMTERELHGAKKVLRAAAMTYVASALASVLTLLRLILLSRSN
ncbi:MAG: zinc metallopeptidase [Spirochaetia bacterium]